ncbi:ABC transporter permease [Scrofimicrobium sp. R131]|uniref:ABC transporter permease n=1 Tax=Scrofimicrobium appendicitidis TaxID=3079930 RepID=A0AAU7V951_9ACTO
MKLEAAKESFTKSLRRDAHTYRLLGFLLVVFLFFAIAKPDGFLQMRTWQAMAFQFPEFGLMALGVMLTMITGGIDLSVVGIANMTSIGAAVIMLSLAPVDASGGQATVAILAAIIFALAAGALAGAFNGYLVSKVGIPPILVTLGTLELFTGIAVIITGGKPVSGLPTQYGQIFAGKAFGVIPVPLIVFLLVAVIIAFLLTKTTYGIKLRLLGTNPKAANLSGLHTTALLLKTYTISGMTAAAGGLVMLANYNSAKADYGSTYTLLTILIVVLGGVNPNGGSGRIIGVLLSVFTLQILSSGLNMFPSISSFYRPLIWGSALLIVIVMDHFSEDGVLKKLRRKERVSSE